MPFCNLSPMLLPVKQWLNILTLHFSTRSNIILWCSAHRLCCNHICATSDLLCFFFHPGDWHHHFPTYSDQKPELCLVLSALHIISSWDLFPPFVYLFILKIILCNLLSLRLLLLLVVLGLCCCAWSFSRCSAQASHCSDVSCCRSQALGDTGSLVAAHRLSSCGVQALVTP